MFPIAESPFSKQSQLKRGKILTFSGKVSYQNGRFLGCSFKLCYYEEALESRPLQLAMSQWFLCDSMRQPFHAAGIRSRGQPRTAADELWHRHSTSFRFKLLPSAPIKAIPCQLRSLRAWLFAPINRRYIPRSYARSALKFTILHRTCVQRL